MALTNATACSNFNINSSSGKSGLVGWVLEPSCRGTLSLISTCSTTIFLCTWVIIHPRVDQRERFATLHKFALLFKTILAPELIAVEGLQEWAQCRRMEADCKKLTDGQLGRIHTFYISMLALRYRTPCGDKVIWPNQYTWLLQQRLTCWSDHPSWGLSVEDIRDKSKTDSIAKLMALCQVSWFVAQCILRAAGSLPLSQLESMTLGYIPLFAVTYFFWWDKPKDIRSPTIVELPDMSLDQMRAFESMAVSNKFDKEGMEDQVSYWSIWYLTRRVFEKEAAEQSVANAKAAIHEHAKKSSTPEDLQPTIRKETIVAHWDPDLYRSKLWPLICLFGVSFGALHLVCWHDAFPSTVEMWLWRASAFVSIFSMLIFMHFEKVVLRWGGLLTILSLSSPALYVTSRIVMMGEVFAALRAEDPAIYDTYGFSDFWMPLL